MSMASGDFMTKFDRNMLIFHMAINAEAKLQFNARVSGASARRLLIGQPGVVLRSRLLHLE